MKILVVDDVGLMRHYLMRMVENIGHIAQTAATGGEAFDILRHDMSISAVLCDLLLPDTDGLELFKRVLTIDRMTDSGQAAPPEFILVTHCRPLSGNDKNKVDPLREAKAIGFYDVMLKPVNQDDLTQALSKIEEKLACV